MANWCSLRQTSERRPQKRQELLKWLFLDCLSQTGVNFIRLPSANALLVLDNHLQTYANNADRSLISFFF